MDAEEGCGALTGVAGFVIGVVGVKPLLLLGMRTAAARRAAA